jgi:4-amino-4-deoxy-L-arabinose transferase-like glycosyltransferase
MASSASRREQPLKPMSAKYESQSRQDAFCVRLKSAIRGLNIGHVLILALLLRALLPILGYLRTRDIAIFYDPDTDTYLTPAKELIVYHRFFSAGTPEIVRTPGYPLLLTLGLSLQHLEIVTILAQIIISCFTVYLVYVITQLLFGRERVSIIAAVLYALEPLSILYTSQLLSETLFTALGTVWLYFGLQYLNSYRLRNLVVSGVALAASVYVRPVAYFLPVLIAGGLGIWALVDGRKSMSRLIEHAAIFLVVSMGLILPWQLRNWSATGYSGFSGASCINMYFDLETSVLAVKEHVPFFEMRHRLGHNAIMQDQFGYINESAYLLRHPEQKSWTLAQRLNYMCQDGRRTVSDNPLTYARIHLTGVARTMFDSGATSFLMFFKLYSRGGGLFAGLQDRGIVRTMGAIMMKHPLVFWSNVLLLLVELPYWICAGVVLFSRQLLGKASILMALFVAIYYLVISGGVDALGRYRHPAMPIISALAGYGLFKLSQYQHARCALSSRATTRLATRNKPG